MFLGKRIKQIREKRGLSRNEVCNGIVSISHYSNIELGRYSPSYDTISLIAQRLSVPLHYLTNLHQIDTDIENILSLIEEYIANEDLVAAENLIQEEGLKLEYVSSLRQELQLNLLKFTILISKSPIEALDLFEKDIGSNLDVGELSLDLQKKYFIACGNFYFLKKDYEESIRTYTKSLSHTNDIIESTKISYNIVLCLYKTYRVNEALIRLEEVLITYLQLQKWIKAIDSYNMLGILFLTKREFDQAENYLNKGIELYSLIPKSNPQLLSRLQHNLGVVYYRKGQWNLALELINNSIETKKSNDIPGFFLQYKLLVKIFIEQKDIINAVKYLEVLKKLSKNKNDKAHVLNLSAAINYLLGKKNEYEKDISRSISILEEEEEWLELIECLDKYAEYLSENKKYKQAYSISKLYVKSLKKIKGWD